MTEKSPLGKVVLPIHFEDYDGHKFEQLVYAYFYRNFKWTTFDWYGQVGDDGGRDIRGVLTDGRTVLIVCANWRKITATKFTGDLDSAVVNGGVPEVFYAVCGGNASAEIKDKVIDHAEAKGVKQVEVWSGTEFEERLRADAESLVWRFLHGEPFPDYRLLRRGVDLRLERDSPGEGGFYLTINGVYSPAFPLWTCQECGDGMQWQPPQCKRCDRTFCVACWVRLKGDLSYSFKTGCPDCKP